MKNILVIHGPNLNMLGRRDPQHYGTLTLEQLYQALIDAFPMLDFTFYQTNHEGEIIDLLQDACDQPYDALLINPGAYTHTSIAIRDALEILTVPKVEVHLSEVDNREPFRHVNVIRDVVDATFAGRQLDSYLEAVRFLEAKAVV
ncbi:MAG: 3-dehydroquinate dehydratase [Acholeplasmataceae bacterium]|nr:MAG: 3-dehydroquinate dehydratase [Acholeplasmataceae bacterium]